MALIGWWPFTVDLNDDTGSNNFATSDGTPTIVADGDFGNGGAVDLDSGDGIRIAAPDDNLDFGTDWTLAFFFKSDSTHNSGSSNKYLFSSGPTSAWYNGKLQVYLSDSGGANPGACEAWYYDGSIYPGTESAQTSWTAGTVYHIAVRMDSGTLTLFVDGVSETPVTGLSNAQRAADNDPIYLGRNYSGEQFVGRFSDARFYNEALSNSAIATLAGVSSTRRIFVTRTGI